MRLPAALTSPLRAWLPHSGKRHDCEWLSRIQTESGHVPKRLPVSLTPRTRVSCLLPSRRTDSWMGGSGVMAAAGLQRPSRSSERLSWTSAPAGVSLFTPDLPCVPSLLVPILQRNPLP